MDTVESIRDWLLACLPEAKITVVANPSPSAQHSLAIDSVHALEIARLLRDDAAFRFDTCSNVTGVDWPEKKIVEPVKAKVPGAEGSPVTDVEPKVKPIQPGPQTGLQTGTLEVVYHLYSIALRKGPLVLRLRTGNRTDEVTLPSLTPIWRSCEFQEREVFDLFGVVFEGHPDLRRILMWDELVDHPMRKDYVEPDDYEWEPTPHNEVLARARQHNPEKGPSS